MNKRRENNINALVIDKCVSALKRRPRRELNPSNKGKTTKEKPAQNYDIINNKYMLPSFPSKKLTERYIPHFIMNGRRQYDSSRILRQAELFPSVLIKFKTVNTLSSTKSNFVVSLEPPTLSYSTLSRNLSKIFYSLSEINRLAKKRVI